MFIKLTHYQQRGAPDSRHCLQKCTSKLLCARRSNPTCLFSRVASNLCTSLLFLFSEAREHRLDHRATKISHTVSTGRNTARKKKVVSSRSL